MWIAIWIVCVAGLDCHQVVESEPKLHKTEAACRARAEEGTVEIVKLLYAERKRAQVGWQCVRVAEA